jgi:ABC-type transport system substrate-binding protein
VKRRLLVLFAALAIVATACGDDDDDSDASDTTTAAVTSATTAATTGGTAAAPSPTAATTASTQPVEQFDPEGVLTYGIVLAGSGTSGRLQPDLSTSICDFGIMDPIYSTLIHRNGTTGNLEPELAESWEAPDATTFRLKLRSGLKFQDGTTLDAAAVVAALNKTRASTVTSVSAGLSQIETVTAVDATTVEIKFKSPVAGTFAFTLAGREGTIAAASSTDTAPVGAGPFKFVSQTPGSEIVLEKNPDYWNADAIRLAGVKYQNVDAGPPTVNALLAGDIDMYLGSPDTNEQVEANDDFEIARQPGGAYHKLNLKLDSPPLDNLAFRQAMNYAIDREAIVETLFRGAAEVAWQPYNSTFFGHDPTADNLYPHDVAKAKEKLAEAGLADGAELEFFYPGNNATFQRLADLVVAQLAEVGITLNLRPSTDIVREYLTEHQLPGTITLWPPRPDPSVTMFAQWGPGQLQNTGNYQSPELLQLITDVRSTTDLAKQETAYKAMANFVATNALDVPIAFAELSAPHSKNVLGDVEQYENCQAVNFRTLAKAPA